MVLGHYRGIPEGMKREKETKETKEAEGMREEDRVEGHVSGLPPSCLCVSVRDVIRGVEMAAGDLFSRPTGWAGPGAYTDL